MNLQGKVALVTGASSGIGAAIAVALGREQAKVALTARRVEKLEATAKAVREAGGEALVVAADFRNDSQIESVFKIIDEQWQGLDILINNAGLGKETTLHDGKFDDWRMMLDVNVMALAVCTQLALKRFSDDGGHIINLSSMAAHRIPQFAGFYSATKYAVKVLTEVTRRELRQRKSPSRVTAISPGFVATEFFETYLGDKERAEETLNKVDKPLSSEDIAALVLYALKAPAHVSLHDILLRPTSQET